MSDGDKIAWGAIIVVLLVIIAYCFAMGAHSKVVRQTCEASGWQKGNSKEWFTGYCYEYGEGEWQYHSCDLEYVLAGACEPMWTDAE